MKKVTLKLLEVLDLEVELNGFIDQQNQKVLAEGLLSKNISLVTKYWLGNLAERTAAEKAKVQKMREDLIKKHGTADESGNVSIPMYINEKMDAEGKVVSAEVNPDYAKFQEEYFALLQEDVVIEHKEFKLEDFSSVESKDFPRVFFKLLSVAEEVSE